MIADIVPTDATGLAVILLALVPGYLTVSTWGRRQTWKGRTSDLSTVVQSVAFSAVVQVLALPLTLTQIYPNRNHLDVHQVQVAIWLVTVVLLLPIVCGTLWAWGSRLADAMALRLQVAKHPIWQWLGHGAGWLVPPAVPPTIWDLVFKARIPNGSFLIVTFDDGHQVAGVFHEVEGRRSHALTSPQPAGLYLAQEYMLDSQGEIDRLVLNSKGVMIPTTEHIQSIRILSPGKDGSINGERQADNTDDGNPGRNQGSGVVDDERTDSNSAEVEPAPQPDTD